MIRSCVQDKTHRSHASISHCSMMVRPHLTPTTQLKSHLRATFFTLHLTWMWSRISWCCVSWRCLYIKHTEASPEGCTGSGSHFSGLQLPLRRVPAPRRRARPAPSDDTAQPPSPPKPRLYDTPAPSQPPCRSWRNKQNSQWEFWLVRRCWCVLMPDSFRPHPDHSLYPIYIYKTY